MNNTAAMKATHSLENSGIVFGQFPRYHVSAPRGSERKYSTQLSLSLLIKAVNQNGDQLLFFLLFFSLWT